MVVIERYTPTHRRAAATTSHRTNQRVRLARRGRRRPLVGTQPSYRRWQQLAHERGRQPNGDDRGTGHWDAPIRS